MSTREAGWAYAKDSMSEEYAGPFATREEAIKEGLASWDTCDSIVVARATYPDPAQIAAHTFYVEDLLERMEDKADSDEWFSGDNPLFEINPHGEAEAQQSLNHYLSEWARQYVTVRSCFTAREAETVCRPESASGSGPEEDV